MTTNGRPGMLRALGNLVTRSGIAAKLGQTFNNDRDLYTTFGYRRDPEFDDYLSYYLRGGIAAKVIDIPPKATWRHAPEIRSEDESFVDAVKELDERLKLFSYMARVDEIGGIGQFGCLLLGTRTGDITQPPGSLTGPEDLIYLAAYHQGSAEIKVYNQDTADPRYGLPEVYEIDLAGTTIGNQNNRRQSKILIPWQRIIHVAENTIEDDIFGLPRLARVLNNVDDLNKLLGSSAELYWQNVGGVWHADIDPDVQIGAEDLEAFEDDILAARQGLNRILQTRGVDLTAIAGPPTDPEGTYEALRQVISAAAAIPERVLFGSERGQLAGDQDQKEWQARIAARQEQHAEPVILRATLDRLIALGVLPDSEYEVDWPPLDAPSTEDRADVAQKFADAISKLAPGGSADLIMPPWEVREVILGLDPNPPEIPDGFEFAEFDLPDDDEDDSAVPPPGPVVPQEANVQVDEEEVVE
jgi:hypothetical protein